MDIKTHGSDILKQITANAFFRLCRGAKRVKVENLDSPAPYESTVFTYKTVDGPEIYKIETRSLKPNGQTTYAYYKEAK